MKASLTPIIPTPSEPILPVVKKSIVNHVNGPLIVVIFSQVDKGTVIYSEDPKYTVGYHCTWENCTNKKVWEDFEGPVYFSKN